MSSLLLPATRTDIFAGYFASRTDLTNETVQRVTEAFPNVPAWGCPFNTGDGVLPGGLQDKR
jgi:hypothetical protein